MSTILCSILFSACEYDDTEVLNRLDDVENRVTQLEELCKQLNSDISALQVIVSALQNGDYITNVSPILENEEEIGYSITFAKSGTITIYHGQDGVAGASGQTPIIGVKQFEEIYYWTINGEWLLDDNGNKIKAEGVDGDNGSNGAQGPNGITPQLKIENGKWCISYDEGENWTILGQATGEQGSKGDNGLDGDSFFKSVTQDEDCVIFTLADGTQLSVLKSETISSITLSYVPRYDDGKAALFHTSKESTLVEMDFQVMPISAASIIKKDWQTTLSLKAVETTTRAVDYIELPILSCDTDETTGIITISASGENLPEKFFDEQTNMKIALFFNTATSGTVSEFIELATGCNAIWYTATTKITPKATSDFGANIISNEWNSETGEGVIIFDGTVKKIGASAFMEEDKEIEYSRLKSIKIPNRVTSIELSAFEKCYELESLILPNDLTTIGNRAFCFCESLKSLTIPENVTTIGETPFAQCTNLTLITFESSSSPVISPLAFSHTAHNLVIHIPEGCRESYVKADVWDHFASVIFEEGATIYKSTDFSQDGKVTVLQKAIEGNGIDIVLIGDAFSDRSVADGTYNKIVEKALDMLFLEEPFRSFRHLFNVYAVTTISQIDGYDGQTPSACNGVFNNGHVSSYDQDIVLSYAKRAVDDTRLEETMMVVIMNSPIRAGVCDFLDEENGPVNKIYNWSCGKTISCASLGPNDDVFAYTLIHENNGHGFAKLRDEYYNKKIDNTIPDSVKNRLKAQEAWGWNKNIDFTENKNDVKWSHFSDYPQYYPPEEPKSFEGGFHYKFGVLRPSANSIMMSENNSEGFNAPSREAIYYRIHKLAYGKDWIYNFGDFLKWDSINCR